MADTTSSNTKLNTCALVSQLWSYSGYVVYMEHEEQLYRILSTLILATLRLSYIQLLYYQQKHYFETYLVTFTVLQHYGGG